MTAFTFPGFELTGNADTDRFKVDIGTLKHGEREFVLYFLLSQNAPKHAIPSIASIDIGDQTVWKYNPKTDTGAFSRLALVDDEPVVAYVEKDTGKVSNVVPFSRLGVENLMPLDVLSLLRYKRIVAEYFGTDVILSPAEQAVVRANSVERKQVENLTAKRKAEREARQKAREEARAKARTVINGRPTVSVRVKDGRQMFGQPVTSDEMSSLEPLQFYVLVGSFDENGEPQNPQKAFKAIAVKGQGIVMADGGSEVVEFIDYQPKPERPEFSNTQVFEIQGGVYEVPIYADKAAIDTLVEVGVSAVEFAAYPAGNKQYAVFALKPSPECTKLGGGQLLSPYGTQQKPITPEDGAKPKSSAPKGAGNKRTVTRTSQKIGNAAKTKGLGSLGHMLQQAGVKAG